MNYAWHIDTQRVLGSMKPCAFAFPCQKSLVS